MSESEAILDQFIHTSVSELPDGYENEESEAMGRSGKLYARNQKLLSTFIKEAQAAVHRSKIGK